MANLDVVIPHNLTQDEAIERIKKLLGEIKRKHGDRISDLKENVVFILWGKFAQDKQVLIDATKHHILKAAHPSPFSADKGFFGCRHFSKTNELLSKAGLEPVDWRLE